MGRIVAGLVLGVLACGGPKAIKSPELRPGDRRFDYRHDIELFKVTNGMMVAVSPDPNTNLVRVDVRYRVGAADDPVGQAGMAHLAEHVTFLSRAEPGGPLIEERLAAATLGYNAYTARDETHYEASALTQNLETLLAIEAERMQMSCEGVDNAIFERERDVVVQELLQRDAPLGRTFAGVIAAAYGAEHPYAPVPGGDPARVGAITREEVCAFIDRHYAPDRAILVVSGKVDPARVRAMVGPMFGPIQRRASASMPAVGPVRASASPSRHPADVRQATALILFPRPGLDKADHVKHQVVEHLMALQLSVASKDDPHVVATDVGWLGGRRAPASGFAISVDDPEWLDEAVDWFFAQRKDIMTGIDGPHLSSVINSMRVQLVRRNEPLADRAHSIADYLQYSSEHSLMLAELVAMDRLSLEAVGAYATGAFERQGAHVAYLVPDTSRAKVERAELPGREREYDISSWQVPVDPDDAARPAALPAEPVDLAVRTVEYDNGLTLHMVSDLSHPIVDIRVVFPSGDLHDPAEAPGTAFLSAILLRKETDRQFTRQQFFDMLLIESWGAEPSGTTSDRASTFGIRGLSAFDDGLLWELHWLLDNGIYEGDSLRRLGESFKDLEDEDEDRSAGERAWRLLRAAVYGKDHPYAVDRSAASMIAAIGTGDLQRFRARHYQPTGATVIVTGNFDAADMEARVRRLFGSWKAGTAEEAVAVPPPRARTAPVYLGMADDRVQPAITLAYAVDRGFRDRHGARMIMEQILEQRMAAIRERLGATYGVRSRYHQGEGPGALTVSASVDPARAGEALTQMREALISLRDDGASAEEFVRARARVLERLLAMAADSDSVADALQFAAEHGVEVGYSRLLADQVAGLTLESLAPLRQHLAAERETIMIVGPAATIEAMYRSAGIRGARITR